MSVQLALLDVMEAAKEGFDGVDGADRPSGLPGYHAGGEVDAFVGAEGKLRGARPYYMARG